MTLKSVANPKEKLTWGFNYDMRNLVNFHQITQKSENFGALFVQSIQRLSYRNTEEFHDTEQWCKIWINAGLAVSKLAWGNEWTFIGAFKSLENCTLMGCLFPKHIMFQLENIIGGMCHDTKGSCKIQNKTDLWLEKWHKEFR